MPRTAGGTAQIMRIMMMVVMIVHTHMLGEAEGIIKYPLERTLPNYFINFVHIQRGTERERDRKQLFRRSATYDLCKRIKNSFKPRKNVKIALINLNCSGALNS